MDIKVFLFIVLIVGLIFALIGSMINDMKTYYPEANISTAWQTKYDYSTNISGSLATTKSLLENAGDEEKNWFTRVASGLGAIPVSVIEAIKVTFQSGVYGANIISEVGKDIGVPSIVTTFALVALLIFIIFTALKFLRNPFSG